MLPCCSLQLPFTIFISCYLLLFFLPTMFFQFSLFIWLLLLDALSYMKYNNKFSEPQLASVIYITLSQSPLLCTNRIYYAEKPINTRFDKNAVGAASAVPVSFRYALPSLVSVILRLPTNHNYFNANTFAPCRLFVLVISGRICFCFITFWLLKYQKRYFAIDKCHIWRQKITVNVILKPFVYIYRVVSLLARQLPKLFIGMGWAMVRAELSWEFWASNSFPHHVQIFNSDDWCCHFLLFISPLISPNLYIHVYRCIWVYTSSIISLEWFSTDDDESQMRYKTRKNNLKTTTND